MMMTRMLFAVPLLVFAAGCGGPGGNADVPTAQPAGETAVDTGEHVVHFNALSTDELPPEFASAYNIVRSKNRAMLNVSVIRSSDGAPVPADVTVKVHNLTQQLKTMTMRRIDEQDAIYYIGVTPVANQETLVFTIAVTPEGSDEPTDIRFQRQFYTDG